MTATRVHPTAEVSPEASVGDGTVIWQHCVVLAGARIGARCKLGHNVFVEGGAVLGQGVTVKDNVTVYDGVTIADDVFVGPAAVFTNVLQPRAFLSQKDAFWPTRIGTGATIGAGAVIVCGTTIGAFAFVGAGAVVTADVPDHALVAGNPARQAGWVGRDGRKLSEDLVCRQTGERYRAGERGLVMERPEAARDFGKR